ncbi:MAG: shikimate dehydrogenase [Nitrospirales bacterium]|nr:shikimate dehydrogenase [Nitrospira sp.]MDR4500569.1 shikimate dehydrogenase [Nitrospirales bacterium]
MTITTQTQLCGVLGNPVHHSLSPAIHNAAFQHLGLNYVYLALPLKEDVEGALRGIRALGNLRGFSVTIPHKVAVMPYLDEIDPTARHIGSVNTIVKDQGRLVGYNTDATGALLALEQDGTSLEGQRVLMLGSGGAARAIAFGLAVEGKVKDLTILGIDDVERRALAQDIRERTSLTVADAHLTEEALKSAMAVSQVLVHCTPIGMHPAVNASCVKKDFFRRDLTVMDIVYNPLETRLLREAREAGCRTIRGVEMFVNQAVGQFEKWTGQAAPVDVMRKVLEEHFR